eukprot:TRINITY_DN22199_c0_g1_i1.p1 TRINITY_DN22199_c0_g1~~TRINITY_DN22199_c0_g1_i1.p1  ORF type:complete len:629 (-),score=87.12 TRINITY_DN22199_c0_g1_i1:1143-3029(-)
MPVAPEEMGLYVESPQLGLCEKTAQLRRFCSLPGRVEDAQSHHLNRPHSKLLRCYDYMPSSATAAVTIASGMHAHAPRLQVRVDMEDSPSSPQTSPGSSPSSDQSHYDIDQHLSSQGGQNKHEPSYGLLDEHHATVDVYGCDEFRMFEFKVRRCMRGRSHDWTECPFAHPGEKARRRDPRRFHYSGTACPDFRKGTCRRGDACEYAHGVFECWLHPARYRTQPCKDGRNCRRRVCFFAHAQEQLRLLPAAAAAASLSVLRSPPSQPHSPAPALHSPSPSTASSYLSPQASPSSTPSLISAFHSPCSTPGVSSHMSQFSQNHAPSTASTLCCQGMSPPPLSPPLSPTCSPPCSPPLSGTMCKWSVNHAPNVGYPCDHGAVARPCTLDRFNSYPPSGASTADLAAATRQAHRQLAMLQVAQAACPPTMSQPGSSAPIYPPTSGPAFNQQQTSNAAAMSDLLANLSAMNFQQNNPFWLQAQVAAAALHAQKLSLERGQFHPHGGNDNASVHNQQLQDQPSPLQAQFCGLNTNTGSLFGAASPMPVPRSEKWGGGERTVMEDLESNIPLRVESGKNLRAEVYAKLLKREDSHGSLVQAEMDWVSELLKEEKETFTGPAWDVWAHSWAVNNLN